MHPYASLPEKQRVACAVGLDTKACDEMPIFDELGLRAGCDENVATLTFY